MPFDFGWSLFVDFEVQLNFTDSDCSSLLRPIERNETFHIGVCVLLVSSLKALRLTRSQVFPAKGPSKMFQL